MNKIKIPKGRLKTKTESRIRYIYKNRGFYSNANNTIDISGFTFTNLPGGIGKYSQGVSLSNNSPFTDAGNISYSFNGTDGFIQINPSNDTALGNEDYTLAIDEGYTKFILN